MSSKASEYEELIKEAEKNLKTSLFKWRPDYDLAANSYQKAAIGFRSIKQFEKSLECHLKSANCFQSNNQYFSAAKAYEQAALICGKDLNNWNKSVEYLNKASNLFREHGVPDTAALSLDKGAKMIQAHLPEKAAELFTQASEVSMLENKSGQAAEFCSRAARIYIKLMKLDEASQAINNQAEHLQASGDNRSLGRLIVCKVLVYLAKEDFVAAQKCYNEGRVYVEEDEIYTMNQLLKGFDEMDSKEIVTALNSPFIKNLDNEYAKLARSIQQKHGAIIQSTPVHQSNAASSNIEDDEAGALL